MQILDHQRESLVFKRHQERETMLKSFANATKQMLQRIDALQRDVAKARQLNAKHPSVLSALDAAGASPTVVQSVNIFVAKEKERDTFVRAATQLHEFVDRISRMSSTDAVDVSTIARDARAVLHVR